MKKDMTPSEFIHSSDANKKYIEFYNKFSDEEKKLIDDLMSAYSGFSMLLLMETGLLIPYNDRLDDTENSL